MGADNHNEKGRFLGICQRRACSRPLGDGIEGRDADDELSLAAQQLTRSLRQRSKCTRDPDLPKADRSGCMKMVALGTNTSILELHV